MDQLYSIPGWQLAIGLFIVLLGGMSAGLLLGKTRLGTERRKPARQMRTTRLNGFAHKHSPTPRTPRQQSVISPWFSFCAVSRSFHQQLHSSPEIRTPTDSHNTLLFSADRPICADYHSGIGRDP